MKYQEPRAERKIQNRIRGISKNLIIDNYLTICVILWRSRWSHSLLLVYTFLSANLFIPVCLFFLKIPESVSPVTIQELFLHLVQVQIWTGGKGLDMNIGHTV